MHIHRAFYVSSTFGVIYILQGSLLKLEDRTGFRRDSPRIHFTRRAQEVARDEDIASRDIPQAWASLSQLERSFAQVFPGPGRISISVTVPREHRPRKFLPRNSGKHTHTHTHYELQERKLGFDRDTGLPFNRCRLIGRPTNFSSVLDRVIFHPRVE